MNSLPVPVLTGSCVLKHLLILLLCCGLLTPVIAADLALVHDDTNNSEVLASIDASGNLSLLGMSQSNCCQMNGAVIASVPGQNQLAFVAGDVGAVPGQLLILDRTSGATLNNLPLPANLRAMALANDAVSARLLGLAGTAGAYDLALYVINTASGDWTLLNSLATDCCSTLAGVQAVDVLGRRWYAVGRLNGETDWRLLVIDLDSNSLSAQPVLSQVPLALAFTDDQLYAVYHDATSASHLVATVNTSSGAVNAIGSGLSDCCQALAGVAAAADGQLLFAARDFNSTAFSLYQADLSTGMIALLSTPAATLRLNALIAPSVPSIVQGDMTAVVLSEDNSPQAFQLDLQALDADGGGLSWNISAAASQGTAMVSSGSGLSQTILYSPAANYFGSDSFQVRVVDQSGDEDLITVNLTIDPVNDAPSFIAGPNQNHADNIGAVTIPDWATAISAGPANEAGQSLSFNIVANDNPGLFSVAPSVTSNGQLSYSVARGNAGTANIQVQLMDDGGTANQGANQSAVQNFQVQVSAVTPVIQQGDSVQVGLSEDSTPVAFSLNLDAQDPQGTALSWSILNVAGQGVATVGSGTGNTQAISYSPDPNYFGADQFTVQVMDTSGETDSIVVNVQVQAINDAPDFNHAGAVDIGFNPGAQSIANWASNISPGPLNELGQGLTFEIVSLSNPALFSVAPSVDTSGTLSFTPQAGVRDQSQVMFRLRDDGGTADGGQDTSAVQSFRITVGLAGTTDLAITIDNQVNFVDQGQNVNYLVTVNNQGFEDVLAASVQALLPAGLDNASWSCSPAPGAACTATGSGDLIDVVDVPSGSQLNYSWNTQVIANEGEEIVVQAQITAPAGLQDLANANNTAIERDPVGLFVDSFEANN